MSLASTRHSIFIPRHSVRPVPLDTNETDLTFDTQREYPERNPSSFRNSQRTGCPLGNFFPAISYLLTGAIPTCPWTFVRPAGRCFVREFRNQLRQVFRRLARAPMFTAITLITLAAGVGANTVVFSVLEGVLLKPLPYPRAEELVGVWHAAPGLNIPELIAAPSNYFIYREQNHTFQDIGLYTEDSVSITGVAEPEQVDALQVTDGTLPILGIPPVEGRWFTREDDLPGTPETAVI